MKFIDIAKIDVKAGNGGNGHVSFRREKFVSKGGPNGGNGGKGGDIIIKSNPNLNTLLDFKYIRNYSAENGQPGGKSNKSGKSGKDKIIYVPTGTIVKDLETDRVLADINEDNQEVLLAKGGKGGKGNAEFATSTRQAPRFATDGKEGDGYSLGLELKLIAQVGIVGFPNVGKSTLISVISAAKPKIADYHFTTLIPNLGIVKYGEYDSFTVADIPGLIEGASDGKGLGTQFLRHVERCKILLFLLDANSEDVEQDYRILKNELKKHNEEIMEKEELIAISKLDSVDDERRKELSEVVINGVKPILLSSVAHENIKEIKDMMWNKLHKLS